MRNLKSLIAASLAVSLSAGVSGVSAENIAITGATVHTMGAAGKIENGTVLVSNGKIVSVTTAGPVPSGFRTIDATGKIVTPGLMASGSSLGLVEVGSWANANDSSAAKAKVSAGLDVVWGLNPDSTLIPVTRIEGVTRATTEFGGTKDMWGGQGAVIDLSGHSDMVVKSKAFVELSVGSWAAEKNGGNRSALWQKINADLDAAKLAAKPEKPAKSDDKDDKKDKKDKKPAKPNADKDALVRVIKGEAPLYVNANRASDIRLVIALQAKYGIKVIISGGSDAWRVADELAKAKVPVVLHVIDNLPASFDSLGSTLSNAGRLEKAGVMVALTGDGTHNARLIVQNAGNAVANGMSWQGAMKAMTVNPAKIFGVSGSYGTLDAGKDADVVVWSGDPLELDSSPEAVLIAGEQIELTSRQTMLRDRYKKLTAHPAYVK